MLKYPVWNDVLNMTVNSFDDFVDGLFQEFFKWRPFFIVVEKKKVGPICLKIEFDASSHTVEEFTLKAHSVEVLRRCYHQASFYHLKGILSFECFSFLLLFHDIGKNISVIWSGTKKNQHQYTVPILKFILKKKNNFSWFVLLSAVINMDPLGRFLKGIESLDHVQKMIEEGAGKAGISLSHFFRILEFYYFCDASAYPSLRKKVFAYTPQGQMILNSHHSRRLEFLKLKKQLLNEAYV